MINILDYCNVTERYSQILDCEMVVVKVVVDIDRIKLALFFG